jgi:hypothetical protein
MTVVFVGDRPSKKNTDPSIAFVGTPSFTNLCKWIAKMEIVDFIMVNSYTHDDAVKICQIFNNGEKTFVALGNNAGKCLEDLGIAYFKLPHPSPRNRKLNDQSYIDSELKKCYGYIKERQCA